MAKTEMTLSEIVDQLSKCDYSTDDGLHLLNMNEAFIQLSNKASKEEEVRGTIKKLLIGIEEYNFEMQCDSLCIFPLFVGLKKQINSILGEGS